MPAYTSKAYNLCYSPHPAIECTDHGLESVMRF
jgi:hypothetical protein